MRVYLRRGSFGWPTPHCHVLSLFSVPFSGIVVHVFPRDQPSQLSISEFLLSPFEEGLALLPLQTLRPALGCLGCTWVHIRSKDTQVATTAQCTWTGHVLILPLFFQEYMHHLLRLEHRAEEQFLEHWLNPHCKPHCDRNLVHPV